MTISVRPIRKKDAKAVCKLVWEFTTYLRNFGRKYEFKITESIFKRDGFGPNRAFVGWVAIQDKKIVGYLTGNFVYELEIAARLFYIVDLYVTPSCRRAGVGKALVKCAARYTAQHKGKGLFWSIYYKNSLAKNFYKKLGAIEKNTLDLMILDSAPSQKLAKR